MKRAAMRIAAIILTGHVVLAQFTEVHTVTLSDAGAQLGTFSWALAHYREGVAPVPLFDNQGGARALKSVTLQVQIDLFAGAYWDNTDPETSYLINDVLVCVDTICPPQPQTNYPCEYGAGMLSAIGGWGNGYLFLRPMTLHGFNVSTTLQSSQTYYPSYPGYDSVLEDFIGVGDVLLTWNNVIYEQTVFGLPIGYGLASSVSRTLTVIYEYGQKAAAKSGGVSSAPSRSAP